MEKKFVLDTNVLLNDPDCIPSLYNHDENKIYIPRHVLLELDDLKRQDKTRHLAVKAIKSLREHSDKVTLLQTDDLAPKFENRVDTFILNEINKNGLQDAILITNDLLLRFEAEEEGIETQEYQNIKPFKSESEIYTGFVEESDTDEGYIPNSFCFRDGRLSFNHPDGDKLISYSNDVWGIRPKHLTQNAALELILSDHVDLVSVQSQAGLGKTTISLAAALYLTFQKKQYSKIYISKPTIELGQPLGFLPGDMKEKLAPYMKYLDSLIKKLHHLRPANRLFKEDGGYDPEVLEILPINFVRGMNIENAFVIIDEAQNLTRLEMRSLLTRMGENVKCVVIGDVNQVDHPHLNKSNNGLNWTTKLLKGASNYGHMTLKGNQSRGPICDLILNRNL
jgi:PhoH-like ATPase